MECHSVEQNCHVITDNRKEEALRKLQGAPQHPTRSPTPLTTLPRMSSSSSSHATKQLTPTSDCPPRSPDSIGSDEDLDVHPPEDGFELRQLPQQDHSNKAADNERGRLLASGDGSDDEIEGDEEEVLYDAFGEGDGSGRGQRRTRRATSGSLKEMLFTPTEERVIVRKLDRYLVGSLAVLYMLSK